MNFTTRHNDSSNKAFITLRLTVGLLTVLFFGLNVQAAPAQTFVSITRGDDSGDCTSANPCKTIAHALSLVGSGGAVVIVDSGEYEPFTINKAVTVQTGAGVFAGILATNPNSSAISVSAGASEAVTIRGLNLFGAGSGIGIRYTSAASVTVESCVIQGFTVHGINLNNAGKLLVRDCVLKNNGAGIFMNATSGEARGSIENCRLENNNNGLTANSGARVTVRNTISAGNAATGFQAAPTTGFTADLNLENCVATGNANGIVAHSFSTIRVANSTITNNVLQGVAPLGGTLLSRGNNTVEGNPTNGNFTGTFTAK